MQAYELNLKKAKILNLSTKCHCAQTDATSWFESNLIKIIVYTHTQYFKIPRRSIESLPGDLLHWTNFLCNTVHLSVRLVTPSLTEVRNVMSTSHLTVTIVLVAYGLMEYGHFHQYSIVNIQFVKNS